MKCSQCSKESIAKGLCRNHYNQAHHAKHHTPRLCVECGKDLFGTHQIKYCTDCESEAKRAQRLEYMRTYSPKYYKKTQAEKVALRTEREIQQSQMSDKEFFEQIAKPILRGEYHEKI